MSEFSARQLGLIQQIRKVRILVVGDIMLDVYRVGSATRISPEAPVPVLLNPTTESRLGGAGAVAAMCCALGAEVCLAGIVGDDTFGYSVLTRLEQAGGQFIGEMIPGRITTTKERICGVSGGRHRQQLGRIDLEEMSPIPNQAEVRLRETIEATAGDPPHAILISDYGKGVVTGELIALCREVCALTIADPARGVDWGKYQSLSGLIPNREESAGQSAQRIRRRLGLKAAIVKLDQDGCELDCEESGPLLLPANGRAVHDVTGAGDQFLAALGCIKAMGCSWLEATEIGNLCAGRQVERHGCVPVTLEELIPSADSGPITPSGIAAMTAICRVA